jgi:transcriptional antiterminator Rof (Rho-off)
MLLLKLPEAANLETIVNKYQNDPNVEYVALDYAGKSCYLEPDDIYWSNQWYLNNTGQNGGISGCDINIW